MCILTFFIHRLWFAEFLLSIDNKQWYDLSPNRISRRWYLLILVYLVRVYLIALSGTAENQEDAPFSMAPFTGFCACVYVVTKYKVCLKTC